MALPDYEVRSSPRRKRTMTAFREDGRLVVVLPSQLTQRQQRELVPDLVQRFLAKEARQAAPKGEDELTRRARALFETHLTPATGQAPPEFGVRWVANQHRRWGSCTAATGEIRISDRLRSAPAYVLDYVLLHEVTHLVEHAHSARFRALTGRYAEADRARGFLEGLDFAGARGNA